MLRLVIFIQILLFYSCVTSRTINQFASKKNLVIKKAGNINLFNGKIEIEEKGKEDKELVYLLYDGDALGFVSNTSRIANNEFIYKISQKTDSSITLTRATMYPRYYTADTLLFGNDFAVEKRCLYDNNKVVQSYFKEYTFSNDSLKISSYQFDRDLMPVSFYKADLNTINERIGKPTEVRSYPNQEKRTFFKRYIE
jgi:hypothetical protein